MGRFEPALSRKSAPCHFTAARVIDQTDGDGVPPKPPTRLMTPTVFDRGGNLSGARRKAGFLLLKQLGDFFDHRIAELLYVMQRHGIAVITRHIVPDADGQHLHR